MRLPPQTPGRSESAAVLAVALIAALLVKAAPGPLQRRFDEPPREAIARLARINADLAEAASALEVASRKIREAAGR